MKIPWVRPDLCGPRVLVMEWIDGLRCTDPAGIRASGLDLSQFIRCGVVSGLRQLLEARCTATPVHETGQSLLLLHLLLHRGYCRSFFPRLVSSLHVVQAGRVLWCSGLPNAGKHDLSAHATSITRVHCSKDKQAVASVTRRIGLW